jgi:hypothetical protein
MSMYKTGMYSPQKEVLLVLCIRKFVISKINIATGYPRLSRGFFQSLQECFGVVNLYIRLCPLSHPIEHISH